MTKIRLSHTLISLWERGDMQGVINCYFHLTNVGTKAMEDGKKFHEEIAKNIEAYNTLPEYMNFSPNLSIPKTEVPIVVPYNELCDLKGIIDCIDGTTIYEWKTGVSDSLTWARTSQIPLYFLLCEMAGIEVHSAYVVRYNQYLNKTDFVIVHNSKKLRDKARNIVDSVVYEIHNYFSEQGLI